MARKKMAKRPSLVVKCWWCGKEIDLVKAKWCECSLPVEASSDQFIFDQWSYVKTKVCPHCKSCYHMNPNRSLHGAVKAPPSLRKEGIELLHEDVAKANGWTGSF